MSIKKYSKYIDYFNNILEFKSKYDIINDLEDIDDIDLVINYFYRKGIIRRITKNGITYFISKRILEENNVDIKTLFETSKINTKDIDIVLERCSFSEVLDMNICE